MIQPRLHVLTSAQHQQFEREGFLLMQQFFTPEDVATIRETFMAAWANGPVEAMCDTHRKYDPKEPLARWPRVMHPHRHPESPVGPLAMRYMLDARVGDVLRDLFGEEAVAAQSMFYFKPPGARGQDLHQDNFYLRVKPGTCMAAWTAIDDADRENGGLVVVPGSHRCAIACPEQSDSQKFFTTEHVPVPQGMQETPVDLKAGDVLFFNGSLIHGSYPNESKTRFRRAFICHYVPRSSEETSHWYRPLLTFDKQEVVINDATGGGPCGTVQEIKAPH
jgi:hypothetical protein